MWVGIIGTGMIGGSLATLLARCGYNVLVANSRGPQSLTEMARHLGSTVIPVTVYGAARDAEIILVAIPFGRYRELPADPFAGRIVVDTTNYHPDRDGPVPDLDAETTTSSELIAKHLSGASVVKAFNTIYFERLRTQGRPGAPHSQRLAIPIAGDDAVAKAVVSQLIDDIGFTAVDVGALAAGRHQQPGQPIYNAPVGSAQARKLLQQQP
jgi:predicted dinucleotide-binding enzyme